jgi:hypothetical protein
MNQLKRSTSICTALITAGSLMASTFSWAQPLRVGGDVDAQGCRPSAGYVWHAELAQCIRPWLTSVITLEVGPKRRTCTGLIEMECLVVREIEPNQVKSRWEPLSNIAGFTQVPGKIRLLVLSSGGTPELLLIGQKDQHHGTLGQGRLSQSH